MGPGFESLKVHQWPIGQVVKTAASHAVNIGSNPVWVTKDIRSWKAFDINRWVITHRKKFVLIAMRVHLFPSRTQKLSSSALTILGGRLPGKISNANTRNLNRKVGVFCCLQVSTGHLRMAGRYVGLPGKPSNANTRNLNRKVVF